MATYMITHPARPAAQIHTAGESVLEVLTEIPGLPGCFTPVDRDAHSDIWDEIVNAYQGAPANGYTKENTMATTAETITQVAARILMRMVYARSQWIDGIDTPAEPALRAEVVAQNRAYLDLFADVPAGEGARIKGNLYHLDRAAMAGDIDAASRAYDAAESAGIFN